jgi:hypothetical protein
VQAACWCLFDWCVRTWGLTGAYQPGVVNCLTLVSGCWNWACETVPGTGEVARFPAETLGTHKDGSTEHNVTSTGSPTATPGNESLTKQPHCTIEGVQTKAGIGHVRQCPEPGRSKVSCGDTGNTQRWEHRIGHVNCRQWLVCNIFRKECNMFQKKK